MLPEFASPLIGCSIFVFAMIAICLYFGSCRKRKGGHRPGESVRRITVMTCILFAVELTTVTVLQTLTRLVFLKM